jgi:hypothetical protein
VAPGGPGAHIGAQPASGNCEARSRNCEKLWSPTQKLPSPAQKSWSPARKLRSPAMKVRSPICLFTLWPFGLHRKCAISACLFRLRGWASHCSRWLPQFRRWAPWLCRWAWGGGVFLRGSLVFESLPKASSKVVLKHSFRAISGQGGPRELIWPSEVECRLGFAVLGPPPPVSTTSSEGFALKPRSRARPKGAYLAF